MRARPETFLIAAMAVFAAAGVAATLFMDAEPGFVVYPDPEYYEPVVIDPATIGPTPEQAGAGQTAVTELASATEWFEQIRGYCNPVEVVTRVRWQPAPQTEDGLMFEAACFALAGKVDRARAAVMQLPADRRYHAAGVSFNVGHPAADGGDELAAGPLMELVVEFWPNHYMALYHAGAAAHERGDRLVARGYLERFLQEYAVEDGWRSSAQQMLEAGRR